MNQAAAKMNEETVDAYYSYETFGVRFFEHAISPERIRDSLSGLVGKAIDVGPRAIGPARVAQITASGRLGEVTVTPCEEGEAVAHRLVIPGNLDLTVRLAGRDYFFHVDMQAALTLTARAAESLRVIIDVAPPSAKDVEVAVRGRDWRARVLRTAVNVDGQLRRFVARYIGREIEKPHIMRLRDIDITTHLDFRGAP